MSPRLWHKKNSLLLLCIVSNANLHVHRLFNTNLAEYQHHTNTIPSRSLLHSRTLSCSGELKVGAVGCVAGSSASAHVEDVDSGGSEARHHHTGGFGPR